MRGGGTKGTAGAAVAATATGAADDAAGARILGAATLRLMGCFVVVSARAVSGDDAEEDEEQDEDRRLKIRDCSSDDREMRAGG